MFCNDCGVSFTEDDAVEEWDFDYIDPSMDVIAFYCPKCKDIEREVDEDET